MVSVSVFFLNSFVSVLLGLGLVDVCVFCVNIKFMNVLCDISFSFLVCIISALVIFWSWLNSSVFLPMFFIEASVYCPVASVLILSMLLYIIIFSLILRSCISICLSADMLFNDILTFMVASSSGDSDISSMFVISALFF